MFKVIMHTLFDNLNCLLYFLNESLCNKSVMLMKEILYMR